MAGKIIYVQHPETGEITGHMVDIADLAAHSGAGRDPNFSWRDDEAWAYVAVKEIPPIVGEVPAHVYRHFGERDPRVQRTYSAAGAARALGLSRRGFLLRLENHPLEAKALHDGRPVYRWGDLVEWDAKIPGVGRPKNS